MLAERGLAVAGAAIMKLDLLWTVLGMLAVTYSVRVSFLGFGQRVRFPAWLQRSLYYVPAAVLTALVAPMTLAPQGALDVAEQCLFAGRAGYRAGGVVDAAHAGGDCLRFCGVCRLALAELSAHKKTPFGARHRGVNTRKKQHGVSATRRHCNPAKPASTMIVQVNRRSYSVDILVPCCNTANHKN